MLFKSGRCYYWYCKVLLVAFTNSPLTGEIAVGTQLTDNNSIVHNITRLARHCLLLLFCSVLFYAIEPGL